MTGTCKLFVSGHRLFPFQNVSFTELIAVTFLSFFRLVRRAGWQSSSLRLPSSKADTRPAQKGPGEFALTVFCLKKRLASQKLFLAGLYKLPVMEMVTASETDHYYYIPGIGHPW